MQKVVPIVNPNWPTSFNAWSMQYMITFLFLEPFSLIMLCASSRNGPIVRREFGMHTELTTLISCAIQIAEQFICKLMNFYVADYPFYRFTAVDSKGIKTNADIIILTGYFRSYPVKAASQTLST